MLGDLKNKRAILVKGILFLFLGMFALALIAIESGSWKVVTLALVSVWAFARFYYFAFYVIEKFVDPGYRFSGLFDFARYLLGRKRGDK